MCSNNIMKLDSERVPATAKTQWGRLISCLAQLNSLDLLEHSISLGRSDECDIVIYKSKFLPSQLFYISKKHFVIRKDSEDCYVFYLTDLSKNGTYINNNLIGRNKTVILQDNDAISIGERLQVYVFKSMICAVSDNDFPLKLKAKYVPSYLLGKGACGEVRLVYDKYTCKKYAVKKIIKARDTLSQINCINHPNRVQTEVNILQALSHPLIVYMQEVIETENEVFIVLEYVSGGELSSHISSSSRLSESKVKFLFYQMVLAVQYLHSQGITHRDLKPGNILICSFGSHMLVKVTDFGLSKIANDDMRTVCGTWHFIAPEVLKCRNSVYDNQVDIWSLGVILFNMLSNRLPFESQENTTLMYLILKGKYSMQNDAWYNISDHAKDLVRRMLIVDPKKRINIGGILKHPWIKKDSLMQFEAEKLIMSIQERDAG